MELGNKSLNKEKFIEALRKSICVTGKAEAIGKMKVNMSRTNRRGNVVVFLKLDENAVLVEIKNSPFSEPGDN